MIVELEKPTIKCLLERTFERYGSLPSIAFSEEQPVVYLQLKQQIQEAAGALAARGIQKGDRVAIMGENCPNWVIAYLAVTSMGAVAVPILTGSPETDTRHILRNSEARGIFIEARQRQKLEGLDDSALAFICDLEDLSFTDLEKHRPGLIGKTLALFKRGRAKEAAEAQAEIPGPEPDDLAVIIYTSGTTGHSKGVMLSHRNIVFDVIHGIERFPIGSDDRFLSILPLAHTFEATGGMLCPIAIGA
ncbi:MAG: AMP-binding protein, partial [Candidatus Aminicenantes bacterium]|nr:AMP-binding protein [Candidatus Aminicenantes bacterium]